MLRAGAARVAQLKSVQRKAGEASFFFYDAHFKNAAVKILPGEYYVRNQTQEPARSLTGSNAAMAAGSSTAACLWDRHAQIGGMNHFMLPDGAGDSGRYGSFAMELLINEMMKRGAAKSRMEAKIFGGGAVIAGMNTINVGERNTNFVIDYLKTERIPIVSKDVMDIYPRKVCFLPHSGKAMVKRLAPASTEALVQQDRLAAQKAQPVVATGGSVDLF